MSQTKREYRVRPVTRYVVTEWKQVTDDEGRTASSTTALGIFENEEHAERVAQALEAATCRPAPMPAMVIGDQPNGLGARIVEARTRIGLSQADLARRVGISPQAMQLIECGHTKRPRFILEIARELGVEPSDLFGAPINPVATVNPQRLITARERAGLSQADVARIVGQTQQAIAAIEAGNISRPTRAREMAHALGVSEDWLAGTED